MRRPFLRRGSSAPKRARRSLLRRIGIGPRLWMFVVLPAAALVGLIGLLVWTDVQAIDDLRQFESNANRVTALVDARSKVQAERHDLTDADAVAILEEGPLAEDLFGSAAFDLVDQSTGIDIGDELLVARGLAQTEIKESLSHYNTLMNLIDDAIRNQLNQSPDGQIDRRGDALLALLAAEEALLQEDLEIQLGRPNALSIARLHASETEELARFARDASAASQRKLESITISPAWRTTGLLRAQFFDAPTRGIDLERWTESSSERALAIDELVAEEAAGFASATSSLAARGVDRIVFLGAIVTSVLIVGALATLAIRRSIVQPLGSIGTAARKLSKGQLAAVSDNATDEIGEVAQAFSSLHDTMESLWTDVDTIDRSASKGEFDQRIGTSGLQGDWRRLAETMNSTLATAEEHRRSVQSELRRRDVLTEITSQALNAESTERLTAVVLRHLPEALPGSHVHVHQHPSGPPLFSLGIPLEATISALELPSLADHAQLVDLRDTTGVASLVDFGSGPPAVLVLNFGDTVPDDPGPVIGLVEAAAGVLAQAHRRQAAEWSATHHLEHDSLTGVYNAAGFQRWFSEVAPDAEWTLVGAQPLRLDVLDSTYGRDARNTVLSVVSRRLRRSLTEHEQIARIGDPEFVMAVPRAEADDLVERVLDAFSHPLSVADELISVDLTIGVAAVDSDLEKSLANVATAARQGEGRSTSVVHFDEKHRERAVRHSQLERWLETAIDNSDLQLYFQPIVNAVTTVIEGYEGLIRGSLNGEPVSPAEFIPLAEQTGLILEIGQFTLREACAALPFLPGDEPYVSVNLSPVELSDPGLIDRMDSIITNARIDRSRLVLEVTEGSAATEEDVQRLHEVRALGVKIAIDDFGTGQSNLAYLTTLPAQILKIDRSLVTPMVDDRNARKVVEGAVKMAHDIGMSVVAEGVETNEELNALRRVRCDRIQGYLTGRPEPLSQIVEVMSTPRTTITSPEVAR